MATRLKSIHVQNYRSLADVSLELKPVNILLGPNGAGKLTLLDTIYFVHDCDIHGVEFASAKRGQGFGLLFDRADPSERIRLKLATDLVDYELTLSLSAGRIEPAVGERLYSLDRQTLLLERRTGTSKASIFDVQSNQMISVELREPEKLSLRRYLDPPYVGEVTDFEHMLIASLIYNSRSLDLAGLKVQGSPTGIESYIQEDGKNLWSALRFLEGRRLLDDRYDTIMRYMAEAFPTFKGLVIEPTAPTVLYASFLEQYRQNLIPASGMPDGYFQLLILLTVLFFERRYPSLLVLFDEPETSLHPWALAVLAKAIKQATGEWGKQLILATHSPVLISQFEPEQILLVGQEDGRTQITRLGAVPK